MNKRTFTMIELLIVIAIIAVLMGIAIAVSGTLMAKAENNACASLIQKVLGACEKFKGDFGTYPGELNASRNRDEAREGLVPVGQPLAGMVYVPARHRGPRGENGEQREADPPRQSARRRQGLRALAALLPVPPLRCHSPSAVLYVAVAQLDAYRAGLHRVNGVRIVVADPVSDDSVGLRCGYDDVRTARGALGFETYHVRRSLYLGSARTAQKIGVVCHVQSPSLVALRHA